VLLLVSCATSTPKGSAKQALTRPLEERITWPEKYRPDRAQFFVHNEITMAAPAKVIWEILLDAEAWPQWYRGAKEVKIIKGGSQKISANSVVHWKTMGMYFDSEVREFQPYRRLAWESRKAVIQGYHAWLILPQPDGSCKVITEESFQGPLGRLQGIFIPNKLHGLHQEFLEGLKVKTEAQAQRKVTNKQ
jgi:uncharacterized membrane protein